MKTFKKIVLELIKRGETIATMESCTGGGVANAITSIEGASEVLRFSAVTYSNEYKIKMGVSSAIIDKYSVYSAQTAASMAKSISDFTESDLGIGVTGKINTPDPANLRGSDSEIFVCIYDREIHYYDQFKIDAMPNVERNINKEYIVNVIGTYLTNYLTRKKEMRDIKRLMLTEE